MNRFQTTDWKGAIIHVVIVVSVTLFLFAWTALFMFLPRTHGPETLKEKTCITYPESKVTICAHNHEEYRVYE